MAAPNHVKQINTKIIQTMQRPLQGSQCDDGDGISWKKKEREKKTRSIGRTRFIAKSLTRRRQKEKNVREMGPRSRKAELVTFALRRRFHPSVFFSFARVHFIIRLN